MGVGYVTYTCLRGGESVCPQPLITWSRVCNPSVQ